jgi:hypothetical protein
MTMPATRPSIARLLALTLALAAGAPPVAADPAPASKPTTTQLARAKQAFTDGKKLHDAGKLDAAIEKFKLSYELSRNPLLLYNIAVTMEELGAGNYDLAVVYYRKFLDQAPADAEQRADATARVTALTQKLGAPAPEPTAPVSPPAPAPPTVPAVAFAHQPVESAPPGSPLDLSATLPDDGAQTATLYFRAGGEVGFASTPMVRHDHEVVGRIPAARLTGDVVHYYIEVRDAHGELVTRAGKPTSPNIVKLEAGAKPQFYPDVAEPVITPAPVTAPTSDVENPVGHADLPVAPAPVAHHLEPLDYVRWATTGLAGAGLAAGVTFYFLSHGHATQLETDAGSCGTPPCRPYDSYDRGLQNTGKLEQTLSRVGYIVGGVSAVAAGYLWIREGWLVTPTVTPRGTPGAAAMVRF